MAKTIKVNLEFNANTQKAQQEMSKLQQQLSTLVNNSATNTGSLSINKQLHEAQQSAMDLKIALNNAFNQDTGKLNLNKFQTELKKSGRSIEQYAQQMRALGPEGVKAFSQIAKTIAQADTKIFSLQGGMKKLADTFMNTLRWQITSTAIQGVTSAISETVDYAKELDTSLNNIRIVTGKSAESMAKFAKEANQVAKNLSTTTTKVTDASLIYYQQGLSDAEVAKRAETTIKLANVVGEEAATVSEWMTAIWNNFDDGSEKLEYYADVLAELGAATASSADEIAQGLEKFAAVAETVGLSYEYATSALATVTAETRQSADVVGTAFKTLFARMEGLKLGETLDDGTTLNQYSLALQTAGVNIKDANGEIRNMDAILADTGKRWETLTKDQQIALAQSVAGIRQYNQFMALMDNWDVMEKNLELTEKANGALQDQQEIYEESMAASQERLKTATEAIKSTLLGSDDLIPWIDGAAKALEIINDLLEAVGGLPTILLAVAAALTKVYQPQVANFIAQSANAMVNFASSAKNFAKGNGFQASTSYKSNVTNMAADMATQSLDDSGIAESRFLKDNNKLQITYLENENKMSAAAKQRAQWEMEILEAKQQQIIANEKSIKKLNDDNLVLENKLSEAGVSNKSIYDIQRNSQFKGKGLAEGELALGIGQGLQASGATMTKDGRNQAATELKEQLEKARKNAEAIGSEAQNIKFDEAYKSLDAFVENGKTSIDELIDKIKEFNSALAGTTVAGVTEAKEEIKTKGKTAEGIQAIDNISTEGTSESMLEQSEAALNSIETNDLATASEKKYIETKKDKLKQLQNEQAALKDKDKWIKKNTKGIKGSEEKEKAYNKALNKNKKDIKSFVSGLKTHNKTLKSNEKELSKITTGTEDFSESVKDATGIVDELAENQEKAGKSAEAQGDAIDGLSQDADNLAESMANGGQGFTHWSEGLTAGISGLATFSMSIMMLYNSFQSLSEAITSGDADLGDWLGTISSVLMSLPMLISSYGQLADKIGLTNLITGKLNKTKKAGAAATQLENTATKQGIAISKQDQAEDIRGAATENIETGAEIAGAAAGVAEQIGSGPKGWPGALASLAMMAPLLLIAGATMVVGAASGAKQGAQEKRDEQISTSTENIEAINENQELATSVSDLTQEYKALSAAGESTTDILSNMKDQIPELIDSYKELGKTLNETIDTAALEQAYKYFEATGDVSQFEAEQKKLDKQIANTEYENALAGANAARISALEVQSGGNDGRWENGNYKVTIGGWGEDESDAASVVEDIMGSMFDEDQDVSVFDGGRGGTIKFDASNNASFVEGYQKMQEALDKLEEEGLEDSDTYRELNRELSEMRDYYEQILPFMDEFYNLAEIEFKENEIDILGDYATSIDSLAEFNQEKQNIIEQLQNKFPDITTEQAELLLGQSKVLSGFVEANNAFEEDAVRTTQVLKNMGETGLSQIKEWFAALPEDERTLAIGIDFTNVNSIKDAEKLLAEKLKEARDAAIVLEAEKLEVTDKVFEAYTENFAEANGEMDKNATITKQLALNNLKLQKGFEDLTKSWSKDISILQKANKNTLEYAETISKVQDALEKMFGARPSTDWVEGHLEQIDKIASGDIETLYKLQDSLAKDYVLNMEFTTSLSNDIWSGSIKDAQDVLNELLDDLDTSIEIGKGATLSGDYLNELQNMLDAGVITSEQLQQVFRAKGYEYEVTDWKRVPGPTKGITRTIYENGEKKGTEYIEETEDILVPIINGQTSSVKGGETPVLSKNQKESTGNKDYEMKAYKSNNPKSLNTSSLEDAVQKEREEREKLLDSLREEVDLYFQINNLKKQSEVLSDKIARAKENAYGKSKLELMKLEQKALENEIKLNEQTISQTKEEQALNKSLLEEKAKKLAVTVKYDQYGNIDNYTAMQRAYNQVITDESLKGDTQRLKQLENDKKYFEDYVAAYQENLETTLDLTEENAEKEQAIWDSKLEGLEYELEIKVKVNDRQLAKLERRLKRLDDDKYDGAERIAVYQGQAREQLDIIDDNKNTIRNTLRNSGVSEEDINSYMAGNSKAVAGYNLDSGTIDILEKSTDNILNAQSALEDIDEAVKEQLMTSFGAIHDEISSIGDNLDRQISILGNYQNIIDLVGKERLGITDEDVEAMEKLANDAAQAKVQNAKANMDLTRSTLETVRKNMETATGEELEYWQEREKELNKQLQEDTETFTSLWAEAIQTAYDTFSKQTERAIDNFSDVIAGANFGSMEELQEAYDRQVELSDRYVENYKQAYELSKLNRQINQDLTKTNNIKSQKVLRDLQKEIEGIQKSGKQLTDYELNALQKKYDLKLAEIALEDAQNAKSTVRLRRDSEGNFGYVYTANQNEIDKAQQDYEDKLYSMQELNDNYLEELQKSIISNRLEVVEELKALDALEIKDKKEYEKKKSAIIEKYTNNEKFMLGEMQKVFTNNQSIRDTDLAQYGTYQIGYQNKTTDWITTFGNTTLGMKTGFDNVEGFQKNLNDAIGDPKLGTGLLGEFDKAYKNLESNLDETFKQAGVDLGDFGKDNTSILGPDGTAQTAFTSFKDHVNTAIYGENGVNASINSAKDTTKTLAKEGREALIGEDGKGGLAKAVSDWYDEYGTKMKQGKKDAENLDTALTNLMGQYNITINVEGQDAIDNLTKALKDLRDEIDKNKGIIKQQEQQIKDNQTKTSTTFTEGNYLEVTPEQFKVEKISSGSEKGQQFYKLSNGQWYTSDALQMTYQHFKGIIDIGDAAIPIKDTGTSKPFEIIEGTSKVTKAINMYTSSGEKKSKQNGIKKGDEFTVDKVSKELKGEDQVRLYHIKGPTIDGYISQTSLNTILGNDTSKKLYKDFNLEQFNTGGYTGSWGPEGRLAMLHQKEIVLNASDTENLLTAVSMIREISDKLESNALAMRYLGAIGNYNAAINTNNHDTLQQEVTIHAEFPNATNHSEIEEAFGNLVNLASQYANRK